MVSSADDVGIASGTKGFRRTSSGNFYPHKKIAFQEKQVVRPINLISGDGNCRASCWSTNARLVADAGEIDAPWVTLSAYRGLGSGNTLYCA